MNIITNICVSVTIISSRFASAAALVMASRFFASFRERLRPRLFLFSARPSIYEGEEL